MIDKLYAGLLTKRTLIIMVIIIALIQFFTLPNRYIETDESWLAEHSYSFLNEGIIRLKTMPEIIGLDTRSFVYHKLFAWFGAAVIAVFGFAITPLKITAFIFYLAFLYLLFKHAVNRKDYSSGLKGLLAVFLIASVPIIIRKSFSFRPDMMLMFFSFAVYYCLSKYRNLNSYRWLIVAACCAGLGFLTHLNGVAFCVAGFMFLLINKDIKGVVIFSMVAIPICAIYFIDLLPEGNFETFIYQITNWPTVNHGDNYIGGGIGRIVWERVLKLLSEHQRFFWSDSVIILSVMFFLSVIVGFKYLWSNHKNLMLYMLLSVLALNIFGSHIAERYLLFYYGFMTLIVANVMFYLRDTGHAVVKTIFLILIAAQLVLVAKEVRAIEKRSYDTVESHRHIMNRLDDPKAKVLAPWEMIFNDFEKYDFYSFKTYEYLGEDLPAGKMTQKQLLSKAHDLGMKYIIVNDVRTEKGEWFYNWEVVENDYYSRYYRDDRYMILKHR